MAPPCATSKRISHAQHTRPIRHRERCSLGIRDHADIPLLNCAAYEEPFAAWIASEYSARVGFAKPISACHAAKAEQFRHYASPIRQPLPDVFSALSCQEQES